VVEQKLPKLRVEGSIPFTRSKHFNQLARDLWFAWHQFGTLGRVHATRRIAVNEGGANLTSTRGTPHS
jgi:hypothetical protein